MWRWPWHPRGATVKQADKDIVVPCPKCETPTEHHCGMGACVDICPKCDRI